MNTLQVKMNIVIILLFALIYAIVSGIGGYIGIHNFYFYLLLALFIMAIQYLTAPKIIEWSMGVHYVTKSQYPKLYTMVEELAQKANIPMPRVAISHLPIPNAFAFGRGPNDGRVCVTTGLLELLTEEELKAVLGHEITHIKNKDVLTIMLLSLIPMIMYRLAWHLLFYSNRRDRGEQTNTALIGLLAFIFYFITNLLVLYASRIREYFADQGSIELGNSPTALATALYKITYGAARMEKHAIKEAEGFKAFFINDPSQAQKDIRELSEIDLDRSGTIDRDELLALKNKNIQLTFADKMLELLSTHPNTLKRIKRLSELAHQL